MPPVAAARLAYEGLQPGLRKFSPTGAAPSLSDEKQTGATRVPIDWRDSLGDDGFMSPEYPRDVVPALLKSISVGLVDGLRDRSVAPLPSRALLEELLDEAFTASLYEEEGRRVQVRLGFVSASGAVKSQLSVFRFREPVPLTARAIAKLSPSMDPVDAYLGIEGSKGALRAWGIILRGLDREHLPPYFLTVTTVKPGSFVVEFFGQPRLFYSRGQVRLYEGPPPNLTDALRDGARFTGRVAEEFRRITDRMIAHGHGGTILIINDGRKPRMLDLHPSYTAHSARPCEILRKAAAAAEQAQAPDASRTGISEGQFQVWREEQKRRHNEAIDFVAQLTAVDGATVMTDSLAVLGFGATIRTSHTRGITLEISDALTARFKLASLSDFPGNRHRSAILWCASQTSGLALAIVASQDGDVTLFGRTGGRKTVLAIRQFGWRRGPR